MSLGSCAEGHRKSTYHFMNLNYTMITLRQSHASSYMPTHFGLLFAYLFDRPSVLRSQLATSFTSQFPSYLLTLACYLHIYLIDRQCSGANWPHLSRHSSPPI